MHSGGCDVLGTEEGECLRLESGDDEGLVDRKDVRWFGAVEQLSGFLDRLELGRFAFFWGGFL